MQTNYIFGIEHAQQIQLSSYNFIYCNKQWKKFHCKYEKSIEIIEIIRKKWNKSIWNDDNHRARHFSKSLKISVKRVEISSERMKSHFLNEYWNNCIFLAHKSNLIMCIVFRFSIHSSHHWFLLFTTFHFFHKMISMVGIGYNISL